MPSIGNPCLPFTNRNGDPGASLMERDSYMKKFRAKLISPTGEVYYALVKARHFAGAYSAAKKVAGEMDCKLGVIRPL